MYIDINDYRMAVLVHEPDAEGGGRVELHGTDDLTPYDAYMMLAELTRRVAAEAGIVLKMVDGETMAKVAREVFAPDPNTVNPFGMPMPRVGRKAEG